MRVKKKLFNIYYLSAVFLINNSTAHPAISIAQEKQIQRDYGMFIHFGLNTFNETEWGDRKLPVSPYTPDQLNPDQWIKTAKNAGFRYVFLVTRHHDGFCLGDSKYTDYDVGSSTVKNDVVAEVAKSCKKYGMEFGIYYSLWDSHEPTHKVKNAQKYVDYMKSQLTELLTNYGPVCELWFDGGWAKKEVDWHIPEVYSHIKKLQPNCMVTINHTIQPSGQPHGIQQPKDMQMADTIRFFPTDFCTKDPNLVRWDDPKMFKHDGKDYYLVFEHTLCLSDRWNWFQKKEILPVRPVDELEEVFYWFTANKNIMILNVPPGLHGLIREHEKVRILQLADRLGIRGGKNPLPAGYTNIAFKTHITAPSTKDEQQFGADKANDYSLETFWIAADAVATLEMDLPARGSFNRLTIFEQAENKDLEDGFSTMRVFHIQQYAIDVFANSQWQAIDVGGKIEACKIINFPEYDTGSRIHLRILKSHGYPGINLFALSDSTSKTVRKVMI